MKKLLLTISILFFLIYCKEKSANSRISKDDEMRILAEVKNMEIAKKYSDSAFILLDTNSADGIVEKEILEKHNILLEEAIEDAKKVDLSILEKMKKGFGERYKDKYIKGLELQLEGIKNNDNKKALEGQILYDEYVNYVSKLKK